MAFAVEGRNGLLRQNLGPAVWNTGLNPGDVRISEVSWAAKPDASYEWIELYNATSWTLNLKGCFMNDDSGGGYLLKGTRNLPPGGYYLMEAAEQATAVPGDELYGLTALSLNQSGDFLFLRDIRNVTIETMHFLSGWPAGTNASGDTDGDGYATGVSMERIDMGAEVSAPWNWKHGPGYGDAPEAASGGTGNVAGTPGAPNTGSAALWTCGFGISAVTRRQEASLPVPGSTIVCRLVYSNKGQLSVLDPVLDVEVAVSLTYATQYPGPIGDWSVSWSTNPMADRSRHSADFSGILPAKDRIRWIRWRRPVLPVTEKEGEIFFEAVIR